MVCRPLRRSVAAQLVVAVIGGGGLAMLALLPFANATLGSRIAGLCALGLLLAALLVIVWPQCLAGPYAGLDPRLAELWLTGVSEAQPVTKIAARDLRLFAKHYPTPVIALFVIGWLIWRSRGAELRAASIAGGFLLAAICIKPVAGAGRQFFSCFCDDSACSLGWHCAEDRLFAQNQFR